jgi:hypothetical protein
VLAHSIPRYAVLCSDHLIELSDPGAWDASLGSLVHSHFHRWSACRAAALNTGLPVRLWVGCNLQRQPVAACPFAQRLGRGALDLLTPLGFSGLALAPGVTPEQGRQAWCRFAAAQGAVTSYLAQHPLAWGLAGPSAAPLAPAEAPQWPPAGPGAATWAEGGPLQWEPLYFIDLRDGAEAALQRAVKGRRREWRVWQAGGHELVTDRACVAEFLRQAHPAFLAARGAGAAARWRDAALAGLVQADDVWCLGAAARPGAALEAAFVVGVSPHGAEGLLLMALPGAHGHYVGLVGQMLHRLAERHIPWLNLGGRGEPGDNFELAKRQWRPWVRHFARFKQVHDLPRYLALCEAAGQSPALSGYFPPYLRPGAALAH